MPNPVRLAAKQAQAGIVEKEMPINASNVMLVSPSGKPTRVNYLGREWHEEALFQQA